MIYLYVRNSELDQARPLREELAEELERRINLRNPDHFSGPKELQNAEKVFCYGKHDALHEACLEADVDLVHLTYDGEQVEATPTSKTPSMDWLKDELKAYAEANGIEVGASDTKADILEKINDEAG